jgi:hypothetical protein
MPLASASWADQVSKVNLSEKFAKFNDIWSRKLVGELNETYVNLAKGKGTLDWHAHETVLATGIL